MPKDSGAAASVYVIGPRRGPFKVGSARNVRARLNNLQMTSPVGLLLHFTLRHENADRVERRALEIVGRRDCGDWMGAPLATVKRAVRKAARELSAESPLEAAQFASDKQYYRAPPRTLAKLPKMPDLPALFERRANLSTEADFDPTRADARDVAGSFAEETKRAYASDWRSWTAWCQIRSRSAMTATPRDIADYLKEQAEKRGLKMSTVRRRLAAIVQVYRLAGIAIDRNDQALVFALKRLSREFNLMQNGKSELMTGDIELMLGTMPIDLAGKRDKAMMLIGFAGGFRRSEIVALHVHDIDWKRDGIVVTIRRSKGDQEGEGQYVGIRYGMREKTCPVRALKAWLAATGITQGPVFRSVIHGRLGDGPLNDKTVARVVKRSAAAAGLDASRVSGHSLRVGHVTQARENGADLGEVQRQLRHKRIDTTAKYDRKPSALRNSTSGKLGL